MAVACNNGIVGLYKATLCVANIIELMSYGTQYHRDFHKLAPV